MHFRSYVKQMYALPILCKADVCTSAPCPTFPFNHLPPNPFKPHTHPLSTATLPLPALPQLPARFPSLPLVCARSKKSLPDSARPTSGPAYACLRCGFGAAAPPCPVPFVCAFRFPPFSRRPGNSLVRPSTTLGPLCVCTLRTQAPKWFSPSNSTTSGGLSDATCFIACCNETALGMRFTDTIRVISWFT